MKTLAWEILFGLALSAAASAVALAHDGPEHEIDELTQQIKVQGESADLLLQRAIEYKVLGKYAEAAKDLERALDFSEESVPARRELSVAYFALGKTNEALTVATRALKSPADNADQASLLMVRAGILRARRQYAKALADANEAIEKYPQNVEWYLIRSQFQSVLKLTQERVRGLDDGLRETGSGLLLFEWVDALIDDSQFVKASEKIDKELSVARWKAAWLIRRARVRMGTNQPDDARRDLEAAIDELNRRLSVGTPDALLLAERALAYDLLGKKEDARRDYRAARDKGMADDTLRERLRALRDSDKDEE